MITTYQMYFGVVGFIPPVLLSVDYNGIIGLHSLMSSKPLVVPFQKVLLITVGLLAQCQALIIVFIDLANNQEYFQRSSISLHSGILTQ